MYIDKEMRAELKSLCTEIYNRPNLWRKMLDRGSKNYTSTQDESTRKKLHRKARLCRKEWYTVETLLAFLRKQKAEIDIFKANQAKASEDFKG